MSPLIPVGDLYILLGDTSDQPFASSAQRTNWEPSRADIVRTHTDS